MDPKKDMTNNAIYQKNHTTLVEVATAAGLIETLKSASPFTVFASTNDAFIKLPK